MNKCECGNDKSKGAFACDRCKYLDGSRKEEQEVITAMRENGNSTMVEIVELTSRARRSLVRSMHNLLSKGRVRRYWRDAEPTECKAGGFVTSGSGMRAHGSWVYALDGRCTDGR